MDTLTNPEKPCIKASIHMESNLELYPLQVYTDPISWNNASQKCASEFASLITINSADVSDQFPLLERLYVLRKTNICGELP